jgi:N-methylhydantoinase B
MEVAHRHGEPFGIFATFERVHFPARGREGGEAGAPGRLSLASGTVLKGKGFQVVPPGDRLVVEMPGGGGYGPPAGRDPAKAARDAELGLVAGDLAGRT